MKPRLAESFLPSGPLRLFVMRILRPLVFARMLPAPHQPHTLSLTGPGNTLPAHTFDLLTCAGGQTNITGWKATLTEAARLLQHGGLLYGLETYRSFSHAQLLAEFPRHGFTVISHHNILGVIGFIAARRTGNANVYD